MAHLIFHAEALNLGCVDFLPAAGGIREAWFTQPWANWGLSDKAEEKIDGFPYLSLSLFPDWICLH